jgi:multidrug resistance efflux pump
LRIPWTVLAGVLLLVITAVGANQALNTAPSAPPSATPNGPQGVSEEERARIRTVAFGYGDTWEGVVNLYPVQPGRVVKVLVKEGDPVEAGAVLFEMDDRLARKNYEGAEIDLKASELKVGVARDEARKHKKTLEALDKALQAKDLELNSARSLRDKLERLQNKELGPNKDDVAQARDKVKSLELELQSKRDEVAAAREIDPNRLIELAGQEVAGKQVQLAKAKLALDECQVRAPKKGHVLRFFIRPGEMLGSTPRTPAAQFIADDERIVRAEITQDYASRVHEGQLATIQDDARKGQTWSARVDRIGDWYTHRRSMSLEPMQLNDVRTLEVILKFTTPNPSVRIWQRVLVILHE